MPSKGYEHEHNAGDLPYTPPPRVCACKIDAHPLPEGFVAVDAGCKLHAALIMHRYGLEATTIVRSVEDSRRHYPKGSA